MYCQMIITRIWLWIVFIIQCVHSLTAAPKLLVISFDGFRYDYMTENATPTLFNLARRGVTGNMRSQFVTKTLPNHFSIATGLYEDRHGIIHNQMFDPKLNDTFKVDTTDSKWWDNHVSMPIYLANQNYNDGRNRVSAGMMWPGSDAKIRGQLPKYVVGFNHKTEWKVKADQIISWFTNLQVNCVFSYFDEPDFSAHIHGPFSDEVKAQITIVDRIVSYLLDHLKQHSVLDQLNIIIVSDHGMSEINGQVIELDSLISPDTYDFYGSSPNFNILPKKGKLDEVYNTLKAVSEKNHFSIYKREEVPREYHYTHNQRILPLVLVAHDGWDVTQNLSHFWHKKTEVWGNHGYNQSLPSMRPLFLAAGPAFKSHFIHEAIFENIDLYPLMCFVLQLQPISSFPSNGTFSQISDILVPVSIQRIGQVLPEKGFTIIVVLGLGFLVIMFGGVFLVACSAFERKVKIDKNYDFDPVINIDLHGIMEDRKDKPPQGVKGYKKEESMFLLQTDEDDEL